MQKKEDRKMSVKEFILGQRKKITETDIFKLKKRLLLMSLIFRFFLCGVEYSVVLPTALLYMKKLHAGTLFTGLTIAAYPAAAMISLPLFGYLYDKTRRMKELLFLLNFFELFGNILYALPYSMWCPGIGRFIAGLGDGFLALAIGEITYLYSPTERIGILSIMELGRVGGLVLGPSFSFIVENKTYYVSTWLLDDNTLPGVLMAFLWLLMELVTICCVFNLVKELQESSPLSSDDEATMPLIDEKEEEDTSDETSEEEEGKKENAEDDEEEEEDKEEKIQIFDDEIDLGTGKDVKQFSKPDLFGGHLPHVETDTEDNDLPSRPISLHSSKSSLLSEKSRKRSTKSSHKQSLETPEEKTYWEKMKEVICIEFLVIILVDTVLWFSQTNFEILAPYITEFAYHWSPQIMGLVYVVGGIELIIVFLMLYFAATRFKFKDTSLICLSLIFTQISCALLIYESIPKDMSTRYGIFSAISICVFASIPLNLVCSKNLLTKLFRPELQGFVQGITSAISRTTMITGPIVSGYVFKDRKSYGAIISIVCFFTLVIFFSIISRIHKKTKEIKKLLKEKLRKTK